MPTGAEFPAEDRALWTEVPSRGGLLDGGPATGRSAGFARERSNSATAKKLDDLLVVLRRIVDTQPGRIPDAFEAAASALWEFRGDSSRTLPSRKMCCARIVADARPKLADLPREDAARAERVFIIADSHVSSEWSSYRPALERFVEQYRGTEAALLTEVDVIANGGVSQQMLDSLDGFVRVHPGTTAAAKALYQLGFQWHTIDVLGGSSLATPTQHPVLPGPRIVKELESGRYPRSEWTEKAPSLIWQFFFPDKVKIAPDNLDRLLVTVEDFAVTHFDLRLIFQAAPPWRIPHVAPGGALPSGRRPDGRSRSGVFRLEKRVADSSSVPFVRATFYLQAPQPNRRRSALSGSPRRAGCWGRSRSAQESRGLVRAPPGAGTLAAMDFAEGNYADARASFRRYVGAYPDSNWAWVSQHPRRPMRRGAGECGRGGPDVSGGHSVRRKCPDGPPCLATSTPARTLNSPVIFRGRWKNMNGRLAPGAGTPRPSTRHTGGARRPVDPFLLPASAGGVARDALVLRIAQLQRLLSVPGGVRLERGRVLLASGG